MRLLNAEKEARKTTLLLSNNTNNIALISYQEFIQQSLNSISWPVSSPLGSRPSCNKGRKKDYVV